MADPLAAFDPYSTGGVLGGVVVLARLAETVWRWGAKKRRNGSDPEARSLAALEKMAEHTHDIRGLLERQGEGLAQIAHLCGTLLNEEHRTQETQRLMLDRLEREVIPRAEKITDKIEQVVGKVDELDDKLQIK